ncbi:MAG TPA: flagellar basal-body rod protein FlgG [Rhodospirillaceae bacterium]|jgi:flagellar basal-body rod protein FlgG|nr:flagellar basal-body rod protein FlgG [Alphaproteobacteria bacterium]HBH26551.1 flagellar basal-body rod protein FlgG [Rhodospirillaceae bacterium]
MRALDIGATGMLAQQMHVEVTANNLANMTTTGFKQRSPAFVDLLYQTVDQPGMPTSDAGTLSPSGMQLGLGVRPGAVYRLHEQGPVKRTESEMDLALIGDGFFQIDLPDGRTAYTRDGTFQVNENGEMVTIQGHLLQPGITVPDNAVNIDINESGEVWVKIRGQAALQNLGQLELATFINPPGLEAIGNNLLVETNASGTPTTGVPNEENFARILQGALEQSNVNAVEEITNLITAQRAYEMNSQVVSTAGEMMQTTSQLR